MKKLLIISTVWLLTANGFSQKESTTRAFTLMQAKEYKAALACLDSCTKKGKGAKDAEAWYYKGCANKEIYLEQEKTNPESPARMAALECFKKAMELDTSKANATKSKANISYLISLLYNDLSPSIDTINYPVALRNFEVFKKYYPIADASANHTEFTKYENAIKMALATQVYFSLYVNNAAHNILYYNRAKQLYEQVLKAEQNPTATQNLALLEYNKELFSLRKR